MSHEWRVQIALHVCRQRQQQRVSVGATRLYLAVRELWALVCSQQVGFCR